MPCGDNQAFKVVSTCPATCLNPSGSTNCGIIEPIEGCYCNPGYVLSNDSCVLPSACGCVLPYESGVLQVVNFIHEFLLIRIFFQMPINIIPSTHLTDYIFSSPEKILSTPENIFSSPDNVIPGKKNFRPRKTLFRPRIMSSPENEVIMICFCAF